ncbi:hypothetical protein HKW90_03980 [Pseudomonas aeruginosa]|nr:hypothetical protein [Pseudomonas aeruginosa]
MISEAFLRTAYIAMTLLVVACALTTTLMFGKGGPLSPIEWFCIGSLWLAFFLLVMLVTWATRLNQAHRKTQAGSVVPQTA